MSEISNQIEALLFSCGRVMTVEELATIVEVDKRTVKKGLKELAEYYDSANSGLTLIQEGDSWKLSIKARYVALVTKIVADTELSKAVLETLSIIAWKSPILQSEVIKIRTSTAYEHIKELLESGFINKEREGRSYILRITEKFFQYFDVPGEKGIREAFKGIKIPEKKPLAKVGDLDVVPIDNNTHEHGKTAEIFGQEVLLEEEKESPVKEREKVEAPVVDKAFLDKINNQIEEISKRNTILDGDELFKRRLSDEGQELEHDSTDEDEVVSDESVDSEDKLEEF
nr:SMC-Scp complex subunit ScpB [archaeon]